MLWHSGPFSRHRLAQDGRDSRAFTHTIRSDIWLDGLNDAAVRTLFGRLVVGCQRGGDLINGNFEQTENCFGPNYECAGTIGLARCVRGALHIPRVLQVKCKLLQTTKNGKQSGRSDARFECLFQF